MKVALISLGCPRNLVDSEVIAGSLKRQGARLVDAEDGADVCVINTCAFIDSARRESVEAILEAFTTMKEELDKEKRAITAQWAKREKQLEKVLLSTSGMYGDLQGIAGSALPTLPALALPESASPAPALPSAE